MPVIRFRGILVFGQQPRKEAGNTQMTKTSKLPHSFKVGDSVEIVSDLYTRQDGLAGRVGVVTELIGLTYYNRHYRDVVAVRLPGRGITITCHMLRLVVAS